MMGRYDLGEEMNPQTLTKTHPPSRAGGGFANEPDRTARKPTDKARFQPNRRECFDDTTARLALEDPCVSNSIFEPIGDVSVAGADVRVAAAVLAAARGDGARA
jgi:hypothetical protein